MIQGASKITSLFYTLLPKIGYIHNFSLTFHYFVFQIFYRCPCFSPFAPSVIVLYRKCSPVAVRNLYQYNYNCFGNPAHTHQRWVSVPWLGNQQYSNFWQNRKLHTNKQCNTICTMGGARSDLYWQCRLPGIYRQWFQLGSVCPLCGKRIWLGPLQLIKKRKQL